MKKRKVCILTATRAEYGLLKTVIRKLLEIEMLEVKVVVTGMHLSPEFGLTYKEIEADGISIDRKIEILLSADTPASISKSMGIAMIGFADYFEELKPDMLIVLGDRYETLAVAMTAVNARIPIAHLYGGDITEGAIDDVVRHAITKMSYLHFVATDKHRRRVIQMGEAPERVFNVGSIAVENAKNVNRVAKEQLEKKLNFYWDDNFEKLAVVTFHPVTLEGRTAQGQFQNLLSVLDTFDNLKIIFTKSNADTDGRIINQMIDQYVLEHPSRCIVVASLGQLYYLSVLSVADVVIGNSSSGIAEAPTFHVPTVNIGDRQKGREMAPSVLSCTTDKNSIKETLEKALSKQFVKSIQSTINPYEKDGTSDVVVKIICDYLTQEKINLKKSFYNVL